MKQEDIIDYTCYHKSRHLGLDIPLDKIQEYNLGDEIATAKFRYISGVKTRFSTKQEFDNLIEEWVSAIKYKSLESQQINHPAFLRIIAISDKVIPYIFEEFSKRPFMAWLKALPAIIGKDVASNAENFPEAINLWVEYAKNNNYLPK